MKAMILAAGFGTRLGHITEKTPKCLLPAGGKTMLEHTVERLKRAGTTEVVINLHHLASQVKEYVISRKCFGIRVHFSLEEEILGTGGALKKAADYFATEKEFFIHNADVYTDFPLMELVKYHRSQGAIASLGVVERQTESYLVLDKEGYVMGWIHETSARRDIREAAQILSQVTFTGIHVASPQIFNYMHEEKGAFSILDPYMRAVREGHRLASLLFKNFFWIDVGTEEKWQELDQRLSFLNKAAQG